MTTDGADGNLSGASGPLAMTLLYPLLNVLQAVFLALWGVFWITSAGLAMVVTLDGNTALMFARRFWASMHWRIAGAHMHVEPLPDVDWRKPHIFLMNHQSALDIPCAFAALPVNLRFIAKHVLKYVPFLGWYMAATGMIFINRSHRREALREPRPGRRAHPRRRQHPRLPRGHALARRAHPPLQEGRLHAGDRGPGAGCAGGD